MQFKKYFNESFSANILTKGEKKNSMDNFPRIQKNQYFKWKSNDLFQKIHFGIVASSLYSQS